MTKVWFALGAMVAAIPALAQSPPVMTDEWMRQRTIEGVTISRLAERLCVGMALDKPNAEMALEYYGVRGLDDVPRPVLEKVMGGFKRDAANACNYAWRMHGPNSATLRFLLPAVASPF